jgi:hypothetical protein
MSTVANSTLRPKLLAMSVAASIIGSVSALAQEEGREPSDFRPNVDDFRPNVIEEVFAVGRSISATQALVNERLDDATVVDMLGAEAISRLGDSTVADALRRMPGLSLVAGKFIYIRGLGERYSATTLNGAQVPSPDLTRSVIPLDIFPTSAVESLRVQKTWSPEMPANFAGGGVDMRTQGIPNEFAVSFELSSGYNTATSGKVLSYPGGGDDRWGTDDGTRALPPAIVDAAADYLGILSTQGILATLRRENPAATLEDAQAINRSLGLALRRDIGVTEKDASPDVGIKASVGNRYVINDDWDFGFLVGTTYNSGWREAVRSSTNHRFPEERTDTDYESTKFVNLSGTLNLGLSFTEDHQISTTTLLLRNTDDETAIRDFFNENRQVSDGLGWRSYRLRFEERNMRTNQVKGTHYLGEDTRRLLPGILDRDWLPPETRIEWFYSDSKAETDIPNEVNVAGQT